MRKVIAVLFAIMAFMLPGRTLLTLVLLYGIYALGDRSTRTLVLGFDKCFSNL